VLHGIGLVARGVGRGDDALLAIRSQAPRLLVLDVDIPGLTGLEVCRVVKRSELGPGVTVLLVSGADREADVAAGRAAGADGFLAKPFTAAQLAARVERLLSVREDDGDGEPAARRVAELQGAAVGGHDAVAGGEA
jgi:DNA-binding response OmpR family regulator